VKAWLAEHADAIEVLYLPSHSPELNPDEMANADIKQAVTKLAPASHQAATGQGHCTAPAQRAAPTGRSASANTSSMLRFAMQLDQVR
jgi:tRNA U34 5-methylaminomethyl-2-thiouridine-forming methyltransferase MnmC